MGCGWGCEWVWVAGWMDGDWAIWEDMRIWMKDVKVWMGCYEDMDGDGEGAYGDMDGVGGEKG